MTPCDVRLFLVAIVTAFQRPKMASLLREVVFETRGQAPAPSKDFCQLLVTRQEVGAGLPAGGERHLPRRSLPLTSWSPLLPPPGEEGSWGLPPAPEAAAALVRARPWGRAGEERRGSQRHAGEGRGSPINAAR